MKITDEMVEKARRAAYGSYEGHSVSQAARAKIRLTKLAETSRIRIALEAVVDDIIEECAKVASRNWDNEFAYVPEDAIRSLKQKL